MGKQTYGAPSGGWFGETAQLPAVAGGMADVQAAQQFGEYLENRPYEEFASAALGADWEEKGHEDIDFDTLGSDSVGY